jgi:hypothetical protein
VQDKMEAFITLSFYSSVKGAFIIAGITSFLLNLLNQRGKIFKENLILNINNLKTVQYLYKLE